MARWAALTVARAAVLFLVFNRPEHTRQVFQAIRQARPPRLYVAADGPRDGRDGEAARCEEVRRIATQVDWQCEVHTLFRDRNLGCKQAVSSGIDWFFENEKEGIILEDDCLPDLSFFRFSEELLERYRHDSRVMVIAGTNIQGADLPTSYSYYHSRFALMWGWATWRRSWKNYDRDMTSWPRVRKTDWLREIGNGSWLFQRKWSRTFDRTHAGQLDTWDYQWIYTCWRENGLTAIPATNLVRNTGFGEDATHTRAKDRRRGELTREEMRFPLKHPPQMELLYQADRFIAKHWFGISWRTYIVKGVRGRLAGTVARLRRKGWALLRAAPPAGE